MEQIEFRRKQLARRMELLEMATNGTVIDRDVWNLEYMITNIGQHSDHWRLGCIRSLRRAIKALERENKNKGEKV